MRNRTYHAMYGYIFVTEHEYQELLDLTEVVRSMTGEEWIVGKASVMFCPEIKPLLDRIRKLTNQGGKGLEYEYVE